MKYAYTILPVFLPLAATASVSREVGHEEKLRDHLAMFRQVFVKSDHALISDSNDSNEIQSNTEMAENPRYVDIDHNIDDFPDSLIVSDEAIISDPLDESSTNIPELSDQEHIKEVADQESLDQSELVDCDFSETAISGEPPAADTNTPNDHTLDIENSQTDNDNDDNFEQNLSEGSIDNSKQSSDTEKEITQTTTDSEIITRDDSIPESTPEYPETITETITETILPESKKSEITQDISEDSSDNESSDDEIDEDTRVSKALVGGLKVLLGNQSNLSSVFDFQDFVEKLTSTQSTTVYGPTPTNSEPIAISTSAVSIYFNTSSSHTYTKTLTTSTSVDLSSPTSEVKSVEITKTQTENADKYVSNSTEQTPNTNTSEESKQSEQKANLKTVLDMGRSIRKGPSESIYNNHRKPKTYIEQPSPDSTSTDHTKKVHFKDLDSGRKEEPKAEAVTSESITTESKIDENPLSKSNEKSVSDIRKMYFESLERAETEDMMAYFHRIYPELQHLLGKKNHEDLSDTLIDRLSKALASPNSDTKPMVSPNTAVEIKTNTKHASNNDTTKDPDIVRDLESDIQAELRLVSELDPELDPEVNPELDPEMDPETTPDPNELNTTASAELKEWVEPSITPEEIGEFEFEKEPEIGFNNYNRKFRQHNEVAKEPPRNSTKMAATNQKSWIDRVTETLRIVKQVKPDQLFHHVMDHDAISEAPSSAEVYPSVISAVVFVLFLILL